LLSDIVFGTEEDLFLVEDIVVSLVVLGFSVVDFLEKIDADEDVVIVDTFEIVGAVNPVLADCVDRRDEREEDRFRLLQSLLERPLLPRVLDTLFPSPSRRVLDLALDEMGPILGVERESLL